VSREFLDQFVNTIGSPVWLTLGLLLAFYGLAWRRGVPGALSGLLGTTALFSIVGRETIGLRTLTAPQAWPLLLIGGALLASGLRRRSSFACTVAGAFFAAAAWLTLPSTPLSDWRNTISLHLRGAMIIAISLGLKDGLASVLRWVGAGLMPVAVFSMLTTDTPLSWRLGYVLLVTLACYVIALHWKSRAYLYAFTLLLTLGGYGGAVLLYRSAAGMIGKAATTSFVWSCAALVIACLISAHKASWLPQRLFPRWRNGGNGHHPPPAPEIEGSEPGPAVE
jgi:hypothetical protein